MHPPKLMPFKRLDANRLASEARIEALYKKWIAQEPKAVQRKLQLNRAIASTISSISDWTLNIAASATGIAILGSLAFLFVAANQ